MTLMMILSVNYWTWRRPKTKK